MIKTLTVNIGGMIYTIDEDAYQLLDTYLSNLKKHFAHEESADEILYDMEQRMGELFSERIESKNQIITLKDVEDVIKLMGQPEDFQEGETAGNSSNAQEKKQENTNTAKEKGDRRLFRDPDNKVLGGVLAGIAHYYDLDVTLVRLGFVVCGAILLHVGILSLLILYMIGWAVIPEASDAADRLAMHGEKINVENIGKTVTDGFEKASNFVKDPKTQSSAKRFGEGLVNFMGVCAKILLVLIAIAFAPVAFGLIMACFGLVAGGLGLLAATPAIMSEIFPVLVDEFPLLNDGLLFTQHPVLIWALAIGGILVAILPLFALIHMLFYYFGNIKPMGVNTRIALIIIWFIALFTVIGCGSSLGFILAQ